MRTECRSNSIATSPSGARDSILIRLNIDWVGCVDLLVIFNKCGIRRKRARRVLADQAGRQSVTMEMMEAQQGRIARSERRNGLR